MKKITLNNYSIYIGSNILNKISDLVDHLLYSHVCIITDTVVYPLLKNILQGEIFEKSSVIAVPPGEEAKVIDTIQAIWREMQELKLDRKSLVINIGGGVIGDMGGFAAATYMRGIDFINIPTTLLAQVDASAGGKTGFNFAGIKNLIGTFNQPKAVIIDTQVLATLPDREFLSGFAEIIKHGLIIDKKYFEFVTSKKPSDFSQEELIDIIYRSCRIKAEIVESDEKESGERKLLNFGHTIGHAIEAISLESSSPLLHGEAISLGMLAEAKLSNLLNMIPDEDLEAIRKKLQTAGLPVLSATINSKVMLNKIRSDKKSEKGIINFTLLKRIGEATINHNIPDNLIESSIKYITR